jgi:hypothetical protein
MDDESGLAATAAEAQEAQAVREIQSVVHRRKIALEATIATVETLSEIDMHPDPRSEI